MKLKKGTALVISFLMLVQLFAGSVWAMPGEAESGYGSAVNETTESAQKTYEDFSTRSLSYGEKLHKGIDISYYQGHPDWDAVYASGVDFAFIRVGYRTYGTNQLYEDVYWRENIEGALAAGLQVGVYIFSQAATTTEAVEEAQFLLDRVSGYNITLPLVMDFEYACNSEGELTGHLYDAHLSREEATEVCEAFCRTVEAGQISYSPAIYASKNVLQNDLYADAFDTVWLAHYTTSTNYTGDYRFWQCSGAGRVDGIDTPTDLDFWYDDGTDYSGKLDGLPMADVSDTLPFWDVSRSSWSYSGIQYCYEHGIISGRTKNIFDPKTCATRGEVVTMLYRMAGSPAVTGSCAFTDLTMDYYKDPILWAQATGIATGRTGDTFDPDSYITREDFVTILYRYAGSPAVYDTSVLNTYTDSWSLDSYAWGAATWAIQNGIIKGVSEDAFDPHGYATREQLATMIERFEKLY